MAASTPAPTAPNTMRRGPKPMIEAAPTMPRQPYTVSTAAAPAPTARPGANP
jgi:hypothetical protein